MKIIDAINSISEIEKLLVKIQMDDLSDDDVDKLQLYISLYRDSLQKKLDSIDINLD